MPTTETAAAFAAARKARIQLARADAATFLELVVKDEHTNQPIVLSPMHEQWMRAIDAHERLVLLAHFESGKTAAISTGRTLFELARDPSKRICILSNTHGQARKIVRTIAEYIEKSEELHEVAPSLKPGRIWRDDALSIERATVAKDPSVTAAGLHGSIVGSRFDLIIVDDLEDYESSRTEQSRKTAMDWLVSSAFTRLTARGRIVAVGTCWHRADVLMTLARQADFAARRFPVTDPTTGLPNWPERWPAERIEKVRAQLGPFDSARALDLVPVSDESCVLQRSWIDDAIARGNGVPLLNYVGRISEGTKVAIGVDLGISTGKGADETAIAAVMAHEDGRRQLLSVEGGRWSIDVIAARIAAAHNRFCHAPVVIESVAAQQFVVDLVKKMPGISAGAIRGFKTSGGKNSLPYQLELLGAELAAGKWIIPSVDGRLAPEVAKLVSDMASYSPGDHVGDRLAALLFARWSLGSVNRAQQFNLSGPNGMGGWLNR